MPKNEQTDQIADRALDPASVNRVRTPGIGVIVSRSSNAEMLFREAANIARQRQRLIYAILVDEQTSSVGGEDSWEADVYRISHSVKVDRVKLTLGPDLINQLREYCVQFDIRLLLIEDRLKRNFIDSLHPSLAEKLSRSSLLPQVFIIRNKERSKETGSRWGEWVLMVGTLVLISLFGSFTRAAIPEAFQLLTFILGLAIITSRVRQIVSVVGCFVGVALFNFVHVKPVNTLIVGDSNEWLNMIGLLTVSLIVTTLSYQVKTNLNEAQIQERRKSAFFNLTRDLLRTKSFTEVADLAEAHIRDVVDTDIALFIREIGGQIQVLRPGRVDLSSSADDARALEIALEQGLEAGIGTHICPLAYGLYLPVHAGENMHGCLAVYPGQKRGTFPPEQLRILDTFSSLLGLSFERIRFEEAQRESDRRIRDTNLQNTLLRSVSHDLKTPLTSITGFANQLAEHPDMPADIRVDTYTTIRDEAWRLTNLINNLLSITKLESEVLELHTEPMFVEELVGTAVGQLRHRFTTHRLKLEIPDDIPDVMVDPMMFNQALVNLMENCVKYTPPGTTVIIRARKLGDYVQVSVLDNGPGLPQEGIERLFDKFVRFDDGRKVEGTGLGLAIVRAIAELHGGTVSARNRTAGGARFDIRIPAVKSQIEVKQPV